MKIACTYTRKSSKSDNRQTNSHERQVESINLFCKDYGYTQMEHFSDAETGRHNNRPGWKKVLNFLDLSADHVCIMDTVTRMARNQSIWADIEPRLKQFRFVTFGDTKPTMELVSAVLTSGVSESNNIGYRVRATYSLLKKRFGDDLRWGNPNIQEAGLIGATNNSKAAEDFWRDILAIEVSLHATMPTWSQQKRIDQINFMGYKTRQGKKITRQNLCAAHRRYNTGGIKKLKEELWPSIA